MQSTIGGGARQKVNALRVAQKQTATAEQQTPRARSGYTSNKPDTGQGPTPSRGTAVPVILYAAQLNPSASMNDEEHLHFSEHH